MCDFVDACSSLILPEWNTNNMTYEEFKFDRCSSLFSLHDITKSNTYKGVIIHYMFAGCSS